MRIGIASLSGLSLEQIYSLARQAGFPPDTAVTMTAVAMRESGGNPNAFNGTAPDLSYGLWQINMYGSLGPARRAQFGISTNEQLFDPMTNARAAAMIWGGNDANLDIAWYINRPGYREAYQQYLPQAQAAAASVDGYGGGATDGSGPVISADSGLGLDFSDPTTMIAAAALGLGALLLLTS